MKLSAVLESLKQHHVAGKVTKVSVSRSSDMRNNIYIDDDTFKHKGLLLQVQYLMPAKENNEEMRFFTAYEDTEAWEVFIVVKTISKKDLLAKVETEQKISKHAGDMELPSGIGGILKLVLEGSSGDNQGGNTPASSSSVN